MITVYIRDIRELRISVENELKESEEEAEMLADAKLRFAALSMVFTSCTVFNPFFSCRLEYCLSQVRRPLAITRFRKSIPKICHNKILSG